MEPNEFSPTIELEVAACERLVKEVREAVEKKYLTPLRRARMISLITATLFGYDDFSSGRSRLRRGSRRRPLRAILERSRASAIRRERKVREVALAAPPFCACSRQSQRFKRKNAARPPITATIRPRMTQNASSVPSPG